MSQENCRWGLRPGKANRPAQPKKMGRGLNAQADLHLCCSHMAKAGFVMMWLNRDGVKDGHGITTGIFA